MNTIHRLLSALMSVAILAGCAAALVPETSDPWKKYSQAMELFAVQRPIPAERLLRESIDGLTQTDQYGRLALVQLEYSRFIGSPTFQQSPVFTQRLSELGGPNGIAKTIQGLNAQAETNLRKALSTSPTVDSPPERTQVLLLLIEAQARQGKNREACESVSQAIESYEHARGIKYQYKTHPPHGTVSEHLAQRKVLLGCHAT